MVRSEPPTTVAASNRKKRKATCDVSSPAKRRREDGGTCSLHTLDDNGGNDGNGGNGGLVNQPEKSSIWENIALYYLCKLKNYFCPSAATQPLFLPQPTTKQMQNTPTLDTALSPPPNKPMDADEHNHRKAVHIVQNALKYGVANGVVKQYGAYYLLVDDPEDNQYRHHRQQSKSKSRTKLKKTKSKANTKSKHKLNLTSSSDEGMSVSRKRPRKQIEGGDSENDGDADTDSPPNEWLVKKKACSSHARRNKRYDGWHVKKKSRKEYDFE